MTLIEWLRTQLDEYELMAAKMMNVAQDMQITFNDWIRFAGRDVPGWHDWPDVENLCARALAEVTTKRAVLALHRQIECVNCEAQGRKPATSCLRCHHGDTDFGEKFYDGTCSTVRAMAQAYRGRAGWQEGWSVSE